MADVLVTNGGPHPPDKWASLSASKIVDLIQVDELSDSEAAAAARKAKPRFALDLSDALEAAFAGVGSDEVSAVQSGAIEQRHAAFEVSARVDEAMAALAATSGSTMFSGHFSNPDVQDVIRNILTQYFIDAANISRLWAFDAKGL